MLARTFKKKGKFGGGGGKQETAKSKAHQRAIAISKSIRDAMYGAGEDFKGDLAELQALNPNDGISFEIYAKGWNKFVKGLPED